MSQGQKGFYYDMTACVGCKTCQIACKDKQNNPVGVNFRTVQAFEGGKFPNPCFYFLSLACNHCDEPRCVEKCSAGAVQKRVEDGLVVIDRSVCTGCRSCVQACPYGAPRFLEETGVVGKCDGCFDLTAKGRNPVCVDACLMRVLEFGDVRELQKKHAGDAAVAGMPDAGLTSPNIVIRAKPIANRKP